MNAQQERDWLLLRPLRQIGGARHVLDLDSFGLTRRNGEPDLEPEPDDPFEEPEPPPPFVEMLSAVFDQVYSFVPDPTAMFQHRRCCAAMDQLIQEQPLHVRTRHATTTSHVLQWLACTAREGEHGTPVSTKFPFIHLRSLCLKGVSDIHVERLVQLLLAEALLALHDLAVEFDQGQGSAGCPSRGKLSSSSGGHHGVHLLFDAFKRGFVPPSLKRLDLTGSYIGGEGLADLAGVFEAGSFRRLQHLVLSRNGCSDRALRTLLKAVASKTCRVTLRTLALARNDVHEEAAAQLFRLLGHINLRGLTVLDLSVNRITSQPVRRDLCNTLRDTAACAGWTSLVLSDNPIRDEGFCPLFAVLTSNPQERCCSRLQHLHLANTELGDEGIGALCGLFSADRLRHLRSLDVSSNWIHAGGMRKFCHVLQQQHCRCLAELNLARNLLQDDGIHELCACLQLGGGRALRKLDIAANAGFDSIQHLAHVLKKGVCPELGVLSIGGNYPDHVRPKRVFRFFAGRLITTSAAELVDEAGRGRASPLSSENGSGRADGMTLCNLSPTAPTNPKFEQTWLESDHAAAERQKKHRKHRRRRR